MPTFDTPGPIAARIEIAHGALQVRADDRHDTTVTVRPRNPANSADVAAAEQTQVTFRDGDLLVRSTARPRLLFFGSGGEIEVDVVLPAGSSLDARTAAGDVTCTGRLGAVEVDCKHGGVRLDQTRSVRVRAAHGNVSVAAVEGETQVSTSYGDIRVGEATGAARLETGYGNVTVDRALDSLTGTTKYGQVRVGQAVRGSLVLETAYGEVEAGVREGSAAWLDVHSVAGRVRNLLTAAEGPEGSEETVEIHARTAVGDILIRRA